MAARRQPTAPAQRDESTLTPATTTGAKRGRPTTLTPELLAEIEAAAEDGMKDPQIYALLGIPRQTWSDWLKPDGEHFQADLSDAIACARAKLARRLLKAIPTMDKGWQAPVWLLTQHFPGDYSRPNADTTVTVNARAEASASSINEADRTSFQQRERAALDALTSGHN